MAQINSQNELVMKAVKQATDHLILADKLSDWSISRTSNTVLIVLGIQSLAVLVLLITIFVLCKRSKILLPTN